MNCTVEHASQNRVVTLGIERQVYTGYLVRASLCSISDLSDVERRTWDDEKQFRRFRLDWLSGRIAAKKAVQSILPELNRKSMSPSQITIKNEGHGSPYASSLRKRCAITIAHSNTWGLAFGIPYRSGIGCDLENVKPRLSEQLKYFLSSVEITLWDHLLYKTPMEMVYAAAWAAKEASIKCVCSHMGSTDFELSDLIVCPDFSREGYFRFDLGELSGTGRWTALNDLNMIVALAVI